MSHALEVRPVEPGDLSRMRTFFASRPGYQVEGDRIGYWNVDTGVSFRGAFETDGTGCQHLRLLVNYLRPRFFAFEVAQELRVLGSELRLEMRDPQLGAASTWQALDADAFVGAWARANAVGARLFIRTRLEAFLPSMKAPLKTATDAIAFADAYHAMATSVLSMPSAELDWVWRWNASARHRAEETGRYVPTISLLLDNKRVATLAELHEARPALLPRVDFVAVTQPLGPRHLEAYEDARPDLVNAFRSSEVEHLLSGEERPEGGLPAFSRLGDDVDAEQLSEELNELFDSQGEVLSRVPFEVVLDAELVRAEDAFDGVSAQARPPPIGATRLGLHLSRSGRGSGMLHLELATNRGRLDEALLRSPQVLQRNGALEYINEDTGAHFGFAPDSAGVAVVLDLCTSLPLVEELMDFLAATAGRDGLRMRIVDGRSEGEWQPLDRAHFRAQWTLRSRAAVFEAVEAARMSGERVLTCRGAELSRIHLWNLYRRRLERAMGLQAPRIAFAQEDNPLWGRNGLTTFVRLDRLGPALLPQAEHVRLAFLEPAEPSFEEDAGGPRRELDVEWQLFATALDPSDELRLKPLPNHRVASPATLERLRQWPSEEMGEWTAAPEVPFAEVVPYELLDEVQRLEAGICSEPFSTDDP